MRLRGSQQQWDGQLFPTSEFDNGNSGSGTVTIDFAKGNRQKIVMTGNCTFAAPSNMKAGATYVLRLIGDGSALRTPTYNSVFKWTGPAPVLSGPNSQDVFALYCDGVNLHVSAVSLSGLFIGRTVILQGTTSFVTGAQTRKILIQLIGAGAGGGGSDGSTNNAASGGGGGSGSFAEKVFDVSPSTSYTCAVGQGGAGGANTGGTGSTGGNTTFTVGGTTVTANGGLGGVGMTAGNTGLIVLGGNGGAVSTNGDVNTAGQAGAYGVRISGTIAVGGVGASGYFGGGGNGRITQGTGNAGGNYGAGGGGACSIGNNDNVGGQGSNGVIIVWEFS